MGRRRFLAGLTGACALGAAPLLRADGATRVLTATDVHVKDYPTVEAVRWIGEQLERQTDGRVRLRMYHAGQLGRESEAIDMARFGAIDITRVYTGALNNAFPLTQALCLPYVFDSVPHLRRALDGDVGAQVLHGFQARGLVGLAIYDSGPRCFYNIKHPIVEPADLHGLKIRVPVSDIFIRMMRLFGANPTPLPLGEVFSAMETHMIDGAENNIRSFQSSRHFEAARYWSHSDHSYAPDVLLMSRQTLDSLAPRDRELLLSLARESVQVMRRLWAQQEEQARNTVVESGVKFNEVDIPAFRAAAQPLIARYRQDPSIDALYRRIRELA
ncbi:MULTISPECIES: TRAP transporter substrate-binding protein [unclassified Lysobacter]|uniref:TRAP transporter substrate-binding protein n=1 Tax=unclassified Lysobacter TaxID=2635362 RepID=UPI001C245C8C|nr:TRAP transporter substrate-binding protein [Lysobacter sp. MMG2]MBU8975996.1 TRAP transporter substrate-binding protein [Lysobacter sp. MMG2]